MPKFLRILLLTFAGIIALLVSFVVSFPWQDAANMAFLRLGKQLADQGMQLHFQEVRAEGGFAPHFTLKSVGLSSPMGTISQHDVSARLDPLSSLASLSVRMEMTWGKGVFEAFGKSLSWDHGETQLQVRPGLIALNNLKCTGQLQAEGTMMVNLETRKFEKTDVRLVLPADLSPIMGGAAMFLPLVPEGEGQWRLKWSEGDA